MRKFNPGVSAMTTPATQVRGKVPDPSKAERTRSAARVTLALLLAWFAILFVDPSRLTLPGSPGLVSEYRFLLGVLLLCNAAFFARLRFASAAALPLLGLWSILQWQAHWGMALRPPDPDRIERYNAFFRGTWRILPESSLRIVPDAYHMVLGLLLLLGLVAVAIDLVTSIPRRRWTTVSTWRRLRATRGKD
jgi:hypothetical protein